MTCFLANTAESKDGGNAGALRGAQRRTREDSPDASFGGASAAASAKLLLLASPTTSEMPQSRLTNRRRLSLRLPRPPSGVFIALDVGGIVLRTLVLCYCHYICRLMED